MKAYFIILLNLAYSTVFSQTWSLEKSTVIFFSDATIEDITATNKKASGLWAKSNNEIAFSIPIIEFKFAKKLMQEHFNEKYMETEKYPNATFEGAVSDFNADSKGVQFVKAKGKITIHGVTREVEIPGTAEVTQDKKIVVKSKFMVKLVNHKITIPQLMWQNIADQVEVSIEFTFK